MPNNRKEKSSHNGQASPWQEKGHYSPYFALSLAGSQTSASDPRICPRSPPSRAEFGAQRTTRGKRRVRQTGRCSRQRWALRSRDSPSVEAQVTLQMEHSAGHRHLRPNLYLGGLRGYFSVRKTWKSAATHDTDRSQGCCRNTQDH